MFDGIEHAEVFSKIYLKPQSQQIQVYSEYIQKIAISITYGGFA